MNITCMHIHAVQSHVVVSCSYTLVRLLAIMITVLISVHVIKLLTYRHPDVGVALFAMDRLNSSACKLREQLPIE